MKSKLVALATIAVVIALGVLSLSVIAPASALSKGGIGGGAFCYHDGHRYSQGQIISQGLGVSYKCGPGGQWMPYYGELTRAP